MDPLDRVEALYLAICPEAVGVDFWVQYESAQNGRPAGYVATVRGIADRGAEVGEKVAHGTAPTIVARNAVAQLIEQLEARVHERVVALQSLLDGMPTRPLAHAECERNAVTSSDNGAVSLAPPAPRARKRNGGA